MNSKEVNSKTIPRAGNGRRGDKPSSTSAASSGDSAAKNNGRHISGPRSLIDRILPVHEVHILGGPSGAGKTRWLFQMLQEWKAGNSVLGYASNPVPYAYVSTDRSRESVKRTCEDLGIDPN